MHDCEGAGGRMNYRDCDSGERQGEDAKGERGIDSGKRKTLVGAKEGERKGIFFN